MSRRYPGIFLLLFVTAGILLADTGQFPAWTFLILIGLGGGGAVIMFRRASDRDLVALPLGVAVLGLVALTYAVRVYDFPPNHISRVAGHTASYRMTGVVAGWPELKADRIDIRVALDTLTDSLSRPVTGSVLLRLPDTTTRVARGDRIEFYGRIAEPPVSAGSFDYRRYLRLKGIAGLVYARDADDIRVDPRRGVGLMSLVDAGRAYLLDCFHRTLSPIAAALAGGFLIGETRDIPPDVYRHFRNSGTMHLLAVSGSNVALVVGFVIILLRPFRIRRKPRAVLLLGVIGLFTLLSHCEPSVVRAAVMAALVLVAGLVERRTDLNNIIAMAGAMILLVAPAQLFDVGFQLSFVTAWGLIFATPRVWRRLDQFHTRRLFRWLVLPLLITLIAQIFSAPLSALYFHRVPLIGPLANLLIVPLVSLAVVGILVLIVADVLLPALGEVVGVGLDILLRLVVRLLDVFAGDGMPLLDTGGLSMFAAPAAYACLVLAVLALTSARARRGLVLTAIVLGNVVLLRAAGEAVLSKPQTEIRIGRVPGGVAVVVQPPGSSSGELILTGLADKPYPVYERIICPLLERSGVERLDALFLIAADFDAIGDFCRLVDTVEVETVYIHDRLRASWADYTDRYPDRAPEAPLRLFGDRVQGVSASGYYLGREGVRLALPGFDLVAAERMVDLEAKAGRGSRPTLLVIGDQLRKPSEMAHLADAGDIAGIVCAKIEQRAWAALPKGTPIFDLTEVGELVARISPEAPNRLEIIGLD